MSQIAAVNQELLRQINDSVGYRIKTKVDGLSSNVNYIASSINNNTANINYLASTAAADSANINYLVSTSAADSANVKYLSEVAAINDTSLASTVSKSLAFHKFLTTEHIPESNINSTLSNLELKGDTYGTGLGVCGVRKNGLDVFEEYYNGNYPGSMFGTFSCGKELMGLMLGRMQQKRVGLHNVVADAYTANLLTLDTTVRQIVYGTDINVYGQFGITLPRGLEEARMRDLLSMRAGFHDYDALLWFMKIEDTLTQGGGSAYWTDPTVTPLLYFYSTWANDASRLGSGAIASFADVQNKGSALVSVRKFGFYAYEDIVNNPASPYGAIKDILGYAYYNELTSNNVMGELMVGSGYSNTSVKYHRSAYDAQFGQDKLEHYNNENFVFATYMLQLALMKEAINGNRSVLTSNIIYSNVSISLNAIGTNTFGSSGPNPTYVVPFRENFRNFFKYEVLQPSGAPSVNTKLTLLQSDKYGCIMPDYTRVAFPHMMGIADTFNSDLFKVRDSNVAVTTLYSNLYLRDIIHYNFTNASSNIVPRMNPFSTDPFVSAGVTYGETLNSNVCLSLTNGIWTLTDVLPLNKQRASTSNVYFFSGAQGQKFYMTRTADKTDRYTVGIMSDDLVNNPLVCQGPEFLQTYANTIEHYRVSASDYGKTDATSTLVGYWYPDNIAVPFFAYGAGIISGLRTRQEADKAIAFIQDVKTSSNNWGYDSVGGTTFRLNCDRSYYSNLTVDANTIKVANIYTGNVVVGVSNCIADVHYASLDILNRAKATF